MLRLQELGSVAVIIRAVDNTLMGGISSDVLDKTIDGYRKPTYNLSNIQKPFEGLLFPHVYWHMITITYGYHTRLLEASEQSTNEYQGLRLGVAKVSVPRVTVYSLV